MDKLVVVRSLVGSQADHDAIQVYNGHHPRKPTPSGGWPQFGSAVARLQGPTDPAVPAFASLCYTCTHGPYNEPGPGFLGPAAHPFRAMGKTREDMVLRGITLDRLRHAITQLRQDEKEVFLLRQNGDLTYEQIAEIRSAPVGTVKTQMRTALIKLRKVLNPAGVGDAGE